MSSEGQIGNSQPTTRIELRNQANAFLDQECQKHVASNKLIVEANRLSVQAHRLRMDALHKRTQMRHVVEITDLEILQRQDTTITETAERLQQQAVQLLVEAMRLRSSLVFPSRHEEIVSARTN